MIFASIVGASVHAGDLKDPSSTGNSDLRDRAQRSTPTVSLVLTVVQGTEAKSPGTPIQGARVILTASSKDEEHGVTDGSGAVRFDNLEPGEFNVQVHKTGWVTAGSKINLQDASSGLEIPLKPDVPPN